MSRTIRAALPLQSSALPMARDMVDSRHRVMFPYLLAGMLLACISSRQAAAITFSNDYSGDAAGTGFKDATLGPSRQAAFSAAENIWAGLLPNSYAGETVRVSASFADQGGTATSATLGQAGAAHAYADFGSANPKYQASTVYLAALANHLAGVDLTGGGFEINAQFNSRVDTGTIIGGTTFYYGTDGNTPGGKVDFESVALHELGHGLGFAATIQQAGTFVNGYAFPDIFDRFLYRNSTSSFLVSEPNTTAGNTQRAGDITSNDLFFNGTFTKLANSGNPAKLYAPSTYQGGSSVSHIDQSIFDLMNPSYPGSNHTPSNIDKGIFADMGWDIVVVPEPGSIVLLVLGGVGLLIIARRQTVRVG